MSLFQRAFRSDTVQEVAETFATRISLIAIGVVTSVIIARILGPEGRGYFAVVSVVGALGVQFGNLGLHASNSFHVAKRRDLLPVLVGNTVLASLVVGGGLAALAMGLFLLRPDLSPLPIRLLALALAWIPFGLAYLLMQNLLIGIGRIREYNRIEIANRVVSIILVAAVILAGIVTVESVFLAGFAALGMSIVWVFRNFPIVRFPAPSFSLFRENLGYGIKAYLAALFAYLVLRADLLMVKYMLGATEAGFYSVALSVADMVYILPAATGTVMFPKLAAMGTDREKWAATRKAALYTGGALVLIVAAACVLARPVIGLMYGKAFLPAVPAFLVLSVATIFYGINNLFSVCLAAMYFPWFAVYIWMFVAALNVLMNLYLIRELGIVGAALSSLICYFALMLAQYAYMWKRESRIEGSP